MSYEEFKDKFETDVKFRSIMMMSPMILSEYDRLNNYDFLMFIQHSINEYVKNKKQEDLKMEIKKTENYKKFANTLGEKTGCDVMIEIIDKNHYHFQLNKDGISMGVLCVDNGDPSFSPFTTHKTAKNDTFINCRYMPLMNDLTKVLKVLGEMFTCDLEVNKE